MPNPPVKGPPATTNRSPASMPAVGKGVPVARNGDVPVKRTLENTLVKVADSLERAKIGEYVDLMNRPRRLIYLNVVGGLARGMGLAVGFTLLGALVIYILTRNFVVHLPVVGHFLGELVWIIQQYLKGKS